MLTTEFVQTAPNIFDLESWAPHVGTLPSEWNHLVNYDNPRADAKLVHFTQGIPCFPETADDEYADEWRATARNCMYTVSWAKIMGQSVHVPHVQARAAGAGK